MKIVILRMTNIIGRNVSGQFNAYFDSKPIIKTLGFNPTINLIHMKDVIQAVGLAVSVPAAPRAVRDVADWVTSRSGGPGAVREVIDLVLKSAGLYTVALERLGDRAWHPTRAELSSDADGGENA